MATPPAHCLAQDIAIVEAMEYGEQIPNGVKNMNEEHNDEVPNFGTEERLVMEVGADGQVSVNAAGPLTTSFTQETERTRPRPTGTSSPLRRWALSLRRRAKRADFGGEDCGQRWQAHREAHLQPEIRQP